MWPQLLAVPFLIALNAFFVVSEYAVVAARPAMLESMRRRGQRRAAAAMTRLQQHPASAIGAIQVCITMTNLLLGWIGEPAMSALLHRLFGPLTELAPAAMTTISTVLAFLVVTFLTVVLSELLPKAMTLKYVQQATRLTAAPVLAIQTAIRPLVWLMNAFANLVTRPLGLGRVDDLETQRVTTDELRMIADQATEQGVLKPSERSIILNSLQLARRTARQIMVPRIRVAYLDLQRSMEENRQVVDEQLHTRLPVCDGGMDKVIGWISTKEFLSAYFEGGQTTVLSLLAHPPVFAPEDISLEQLLMLLHERRTQFVFLVEEHGGVEGIVTLQDVVDELLVGLGAAAGELPATTAPAPGFPLPAPAVAPVPTPPAEWVVGGDMPLHELADKLGTAAWPVPKAVSTVGGLIAARLGRIPLAGDALDLDGVRLAVVEADSRAVRRVRVVQVGSADSSSDTNRRDNGSTSQQTQTSD